MNPRMRIAALLVASMSVVGCTAVPGARSAGASEATTTVIDVAVPNPAGPIKAAEDAAASANDAVQAQQQALDAAATE